MENAKASIKILQINMTINVIFVGNFGHGSVLNGIIIHLISRHTMEESKFDTTGKG